MSDAQFLYYAKKKKKEDILTYRRGHTLILVKVRYQSISTHSYVRINALKKQKYHLKT